MLYHLPTSINNLEHCLNMETLCSSTTKGTGCAAAVPEGKKRGGGEKGSFGEDSHLSFINPPTPLGHTPHSWRIYRLQNTDALGQIKIPTCSNLWELCLSE